MTDIVSHNIQLITLFVELINRQDWVGLNSVLDPNFTRHSCAAGEPGVRSSEDLISFLKQEYKAFPDAHEEILDIIANHDKVAVRHKFTGTQLGDMGKYKASGRCMTASYIAIYRIVDGRIQESWAEWDNLSGLRQLGHMGSD